MPDANIVEWIREKYRDLADELDERGRRRWTAIEARSLGRGGIAAVAAATGISDRTIRTGIQELESPQALPANRQRRDGAGRRSRKEEQPTLLMALDKMISPTTRGDPMNPLRWTCKSTRTLAAELRKQGFEVGASTVRELLGDLGYSLQGNRKTREGNEHPDRNAQFEHIKARVKARKRRGEFAVSAIRMWRMRLGKKHYSSRSRLLITADSGGSNASRNRLWKLQLQLLADETGLIIEVCHYPPGTSKWNKIEHRLFCHITRNWRGVPLETREIVVSSIGNTRTESGLEVHAWLDEKVYQKGIEVAESQLSECIRKRNKFHGDWNYKIHPRQNN